MHKLHRTNSELSICNIFCYFFTAFLHLTFSDVTFPAHMSLYFKGTKINYIFQVAISCINRFQKFHLIQQMVERVPSKMLHF